jgi:hypothetical protein
MEMPAVIANKWVEKKWQKPGLIKQKKYLEQDSTPHVIKRANAPDIKITYHRANRIKTLRGIRRA